MQRDGFQSPAATAGDGPDLRAAPAGGPATGAVRALRYNRRLERRPYPVDAYASQQSRL